MSIRLRSEGALIASIPFQLGFVPSDSLVLVATTGRPVAFVCRIDLPPPAHADRAADAFVGAVLRQGFTAAIPIVFAAEGRPVRPFLRAVERGLLAAGKGVAAPLLVTDGRWRHRGCARSCCPPGGRPVPSSSQSPANAEFVLAGIAPLPDRATLAAQIAPDLRFHERLAPLGPRQRKTPIVADALWRELTTLAPGVEWDPAPTHVTRLARSLIDRTWRDALICMLAPGFLPEADFPALLVLRARMATHVSARIVAEAPLRSVDRDAADEEPEHTIWEQRQQLLDRLVLLARRSPPVLAAGPYTLTALVASWCGNVTLANIALDEALAADPGYTLARLTERLFQHGVFVGRGDGNTVSPGHVR